MKNSNITLYALIFVFIIAFLIQCFFVGKIVNLVASSIQMISCVCFVYVLVKRGLLDGK